MFATVKRLLFFSMQFGYTVLDKFFVEINSQFFGKTILIILTTTNTLNILWVEDIFVRYYFDKPSQDVRTDSADCFGY